MRKVLLAALFSPLLIAACESTPNPYPQGPGFYETQIEADRLRITHRAAGGMSREQVEDLTLLRAADATLARGYDWFRIVGRQGEVDQRNGPRISLGVGNTSFGRSSAVGVGLGTSFDLAGRPGQTLTMEIQMGRGAQPDERTTYDARDVAQTIRARLGQS